MATQDGSLITTLTATSLLFGATTVILGVCMVASHGPAWLNFLLGLGFGLSLGGQYLLWSGVLQSAEPKERPAESMLNLSGR